MTTRLDRSEIISRLRQAAPAILPSLLLCDFGNMERELALLETAGIKALHFDVMDGDFAPNFTYGMPLLSSLRDRTDMIFDAHLMISKPERYIEQFYAAGADVITIHTEAVDDPRPLLEKIKNLGAAAGLAVDAPTPVEAIEDAAPLCDLILTMSVKIGFGGQKFDQGALAKVRTLHENTDVDALLEMDGGINTDTIAQCTAAGAELLVAGSAIFRKDASRKDDYTVAVNELIELATLQTL